MSRYYLQSFIRFGVHSQEEVSACQIDQELVFVVACVFFDSFVFKKSSFVIASMEGTVGQPKIDTFVWLSRVAFEVQKAAVMNKCESKTT